MTATALPPIAATVTFRVADYATWRRTYDSHADARRQAGILGHRINRDSDDPNVIHVFSAGSDRAKLQGFLAGTDLDTWQREAGILGAPSVTLLVPQEDRTVEGRYAAVLVILEVEDYDRWKAAFDADTERRNRAGMVGHAISRSATNPNFVIAYVQSDSAEKLRTAYGSCDLNAMKKSGVRSSQLSFLDPQS